MAKPDYSAIAGKIQSALDDLTKDGNENFQKNFSSKVLLILQQILDLITELGKL